MKEALKRMQDMQAFLAERLIDAHLEVTNSGQNKENHSCDLRVYNYDCKIVAEVSWCSWRTDIFESQWAEFEKKVHDYFFGWWE